MNRYTDFDEDTLAAMIAVFAAVIAARKLPPKQRGAIVACLRDNGAAALAEILIWHLPFEVNTYDDTR